MPKKFSQTTLCSIDECPDLMADGCVRDPDGKLIFLSVWGRDTAIHEFLARLTLGAEEKGLDHFHLFAEGGSSTPVLVGNTNFLEKRTTRTFRCTLFGSLIHLWLIDRHCIEPDKANARALAILLKDAPDRTERLWALAQETCPLPMLDHWRDTVLDLLRSKEMLSSLPVDLGNLEAFQLSVDVPALTSAMGDLIRKGRLGISPEKTAAVEALRQVA